jgi:mono/diheme cytochrome c family protein
MVLSMLKRVVTVFEVLALAGFIVLLVLLFVNKRATIAIAVPPPNSTGGTTVIDGAAMYDQACSGCHGNKGQGEVGPKLNGGAVLQTFKDEDAEVQFVTKGSGSMPAFQGQLSPDQIRAVVEFTRTDLQHR